MNSSNRPSINLGGKIYDAETGELLKIVKPQLDIVPAQISRQPQTVNAKDDTKTRHRQKASTTLNRDFVKAPTVETKTPAPTIQKRAYSTPASLRHATPTATIRQGNFHNRQIKHFASFKEVQQSHPKQPVVLSEITNPVEKVSATANQHFKQTIANARQTDFLTRYRMSQIARQRRSQELQAIRQLRASYHQQNPLPQVSAAEQQAHNRALKNSAFTRALAIAPTSEQLAQQSTPPQPRFIKKYLPLLFGCLAIVLLGGYLTYLNLPNISIRLAANAAGIDAKYPEYYPNGYHISKLPSVDNDQVTVEYQNDNQTITLTQRASNLDSKTILENIVKKHAGEAYESEQTKGLTIYSYDNQSLWVNGGILYTLAYNSTLSRDQISKIATSL